MTCSYEGCRRKATHCPKICVPAEGHPQDERRALSMVLGVELCRDHAAAFRPEDVLDVPNEQGSCLRDVLPIMARMSGSSVPPSPDRAWIIPVRLDHPDVQALKRARAH